MKQNPAYKKGILIVLAIALLLMPFTFPRSSSQKVEESEAQITETVSSAGSETPAASSEPKMGMLDTFKVIVSVLAGGSILFLTIASASAKDEKEEKKEP